MTLIKHWWLLVEPPLERFRNAAMQSVFGGAEGPNHPLGLLGAQSLSILSFSKHLQRRKTAQN
jgi:hypothetical protein